jgi:hypothetical protein
MTENYDTDNDKALKNLLTGSLDHSVEHLDAHTLSRLSQARHRALSQVKRPRPFDPQWLRAASFAVLVVTVVSGWLLFSTPKVQQMTTDDFEMLIANEDFELVQELDFVAWMIDEDHAS